VTLSTWVMLVSLYRLQILCIHCLGHFATFIYSQSADDKVYISIFISNSYTSGISLKHRTIDIIKTGSSVYLLLKLSIR
jgi:hypothetical protein